MDPKPGNDTDLRVAPLASDTLEREVFEARLAARLLGDQPALPHIDRFVLERKLGAGGMGTVWLARDEVLGRRVALKLVRRGSAAAGERMRLREARGLARIAHPNVIGVHDVGEHEGRVWLAMEYLPGRTLRECAGELGRDEVLSHWIAAGRGLAAIHAAGLIHRDIKPDNVLLGDDGRVRVIDLGLVREAVAQEHELVKTPGFVGTRAYAAPEQLRGEPVDARADQYAYSVSIFESLGAARPPPGDPREPLPAALLAALARARHPDPAQRFGSVTECVDALAGAARSVALQSTVDSGRARAQPLAGAADAPTRESPLQLGGSPDSTVEGGPSSSGAAGEPLTLRIGHYEVLGELGRGGMGVVYAAYDARLDRKVAVKRLLGGRRDPHSRLHREALALAKLSHPNVIPIYEIVESADSMFIVMELVEGQTLRQWQATPRAPGDVLAVYKAAARGLIAAHQKRLIHRDFKPDNVMLGDDGRVRVMDFGLASVSSQAVTRPPSREGVTSERPSIDLTHPGTMLGTPAYMPPEQMRAEPASVASDVFSFCVALYEALYGERPFAGRTLEELKESVASGEIRAAPADSRVPDWLRALVCRGLAVKLEERHESMQALLDAIVAGELAEHADPREPPAYVFVAHASRDKQTVLRLCEHLLAHGVRPWLDVWELAPGADVRAAREQALRTAPAVIVCGSPEDAGALAARIEREPATVYGVRLPGAGAVPLATRHAVIELDDNRWEDGVLELARLIGVDPRNERWLAEEAARTGVAAEELSPYRGLAAFREQDARWMFGRDDEVAALLGLIRAGQTRFLTLIGASGSGKSSLLMGGVCPMLRSGALGDGSAWSVAYLRPGPRPCEALAHALVHLDAAGGDAPADGLTIARLRAELRADSDALRTILGQRNPGRTLLVIDQLEELFTEAGFGGQADGEALAFVRNLLAATEELAGRDGDVWIAATLRADFVQRALEVPELARALQVGTYFALPPMTEAQIRAAVELPATRVGYRVERSVVDKLVGAAAHQAGRLPLLQHVLRELWARRDEARRTLTDAAYAETGGLEGAIAAAAERALAGLRERLGVEGEVVTRRLMTRLVNLGDRNSEDTRRRVTLAALGDDAATRRVLEALVREARVLVATEVEGVETVEIAHEALLREWTTLVRWLDADRGALKLRQELAQDAGRGSSGEYLWGPGRVEEAQRVLQASTVELDAVERGFLAASERSVRRRRRWVQIGIATLLAAAAVTVGVVTAQRAEAVRERQEAERARESAEEAQTKAEAAEAEALAARTQAERDRTQAEHDRTRAETSQKENERSVKQMFEVALRPLTERLVAQRQDVGVVEVDHRWTPLLARGERTLVAASLGESFRAVVAGHDSVLTDAGADGRSVFLEITTQWLLADQARRTVAIVARPDERDRRFVALERHLLRLSHDVVRLTALAGDQALADVGMVILDGRGLPLLSADVVAAIEAFVRRGGGVLAVGRGRAWLDGRTVAAPTLDNFPVNAALAAFGARWSDADVGPRELAQADVAAIVHFKNKLADDVNLYTRSAGREELYTTLAAGEARDLLTVVGRTWVFRATADGKEIGRVVIEDEEQTVAIAATVDRTRDKPKPKPVPAPPPDDARGKEPQLRERLSDADMQAGLGEAAQAAKACGKQLQTLMSEATVDVTISAGGKVESIVVRPPAKGTPEATCIVAAVKQQTFPRSREGGTATWRLKLY